MQENQSTEFLTLVLDLGSHACRIALFTQDGDLQYINSREITTHSPERDHFEQDANQMLDAFQQLLDELSPQQIEHISNCGICTQRSSIVAWHRDSGEVLSPVISWRDLRNQAVQDTLQAHRETIRDISGLQLSAHYSASKIQWLLQKQTELLPLLQSKQLCIAPLASFLLFHLLEENENYLIDHSNAQRTQLFDIQRLDWSPFLLELFDVEQTLLPRCVPVIHNYGHLKKLGIPVTAVCGDQNAAFYAYPEITERSALINIGTGAFMLTPATEDRQHKHLLCTIGRSTLQQIEYITEGTVNGAASALSWALQREMQAFSEQQLFQRLPVWLENHQSQCIFINTIAGLGSPWWCPGGEAIFLDCNQDSIADRYVSIIESVVFLIFSNIQQLEKPLETLHISGGLSRLDGLCQKLSDLSKANVIRYREIEASALGCSQLVIQHNKELKSSFTPEIERHFSANENNGILQRYSRFVGELEKRCRKD